MKPNEPKSNQEHVLQFLSSAEIDDIVLGRLLPIEGLQKILVRIGEGSITAATYQRRNAVHVLGRLGDTQAIPHLLSLLKKGEASLHVHVLAALSRIGPDKEAQVLLQKMVRDEKLEPAEVAYALQALGKTKDPTVFDDVLNFRPAHLGDSGVWESFTRFRTKARIMQARKK